MVEANGWPVVNAPFHGAVLSGERLNAPREKDLLSPRGRKLNYLSGHKDDQTAYMTRGMPWPWVGSRSGPPLVP